MEEQRHLRTKAILNERTSECVALQTKLKQLTKVWSYCAFSFSTLFHLCEQCNHNKNDEIMSLIVSTLNFIPFISLGTFTATANYQFIFVSQEVNVIIILKSHSYELLGSKLQTIFLLVLTFDVIPVYLPRFF